MPGGFPGMPGGFPGMPGGFPGMPGGFSMPDNIGEILNDKEFQNFFEQFAGGMFGGQGGAPPGMEGLGEGDQADMMKNLMEEFTGFMKQNESNPEMKNEFENMMQQMISK
jgi:succinate dehydrogenase flavin-adding protein (antitoxin of CptAB toxin-antitoxin module)